MKQPITFFLLLASILCLHPLRADEAIFQEGVNGFIGAEDVALRSDRPDSNNGGYPALACGAMGKTIFRSLLRFDLSELAKRKAQITSATLILRNTGFKGDQDLTVKVFAVQSADSDWAEGKANSGWGGDNADDNGQATWNQKAQSTSGSGKEWMGGAGMPALSQSPIAQVRFHAGDQVLTIPIPAEVISPWLKNPNGGLFLCTDEDDEATGRSVFFHSKETVTPNFRPKLIVVYAVK